MTEMTDEMKAAIKTAVDEATAGLKQKNNELLAAQKTLQTKLATAESEAEAAADNAAAASELDTVKRELQKAQKLMTTLTQERDDAVTGRNKYLVDNAITAALGEHNIADPFRPMLMQAWKAQVQVNGEEALIDGQSIKDFAKSFANSDLGKHYVTVPQNSGGGATGGSGNAPLWKSAPVTAEENNNWDRFAVENPVAASSIADGWNRPDLKP